jgi:YggT family protein
VKVTESLKKREQMIILANFFEAIAVVLDYALTFYMWIVVAWAVLSWVSPDPYNPIVRFINTATEPVFYQIRKRLPVNFGGLDISPVIVILAILFLQTFVVNSLHGLARTIA